jgi:fucose permease
VLFLTDVRGLSLRSAGYVPTGFYVGSFIARLALPHPTHTWLGGEHWMLMIYITIILALQLVSWLVHSAVATAVTVSCIGFFFGPFFASGMQVAKETIPRKVRGNALALIFVVAQLGAAVFPAITGAIASKKGVEVLQPFAVGLIALTGVSWWFVPTKSIEREGNDDES